ncbi:MAG: prepilin-type N-terminal cleavage/methylation domain-containing protein [Moraxellaceae bacterium]|nr:prepilin-type N-terminal cleavage/methylation domain-containing protein [Pseudobdellovibrionaceae bacterium]
MIKRSSGFTIIEVILAMMIMASGLLILSNSWSGTYTRLRKTQVQVQMAALLERKIIEIEKEYKGKPIDSIPDEKEDTFGSELPEYSWKMTSQKLELPDISPLLKANNGSDTGGTKLDLISIMKMFTEHLNKSIREVKVEIIYQDKKKPIRVDVVIYMIDYDKPLPMGGAAPAGGS